MTGQQEGQLDNPSQGPSDYQIEDQSKDQSNQIEDQSKSQPDSHTALASQSDRLLRNIFLVAGTTIGAGILALPAATLPAGILPSTVALIAAWLYMVVSGLLIAEINLRCMRQLGRSNVGLLATIRHSLGQPGAIAAGVVYIFLHYAMLVAYMARGGEILADVLDQVLQQGNHQLGGIPVTWLTTHGGPLIFALLFGLLFVWGSDRFIGWLNGLLLVLAIAAFGGLVTLALGQQQPTAWQSQHWRMAGAALPVIVVTFAFQNVVPVVTAELAGDTRQIRRCIWLGALLPLIMFLLWNAVMLGSTDSDAALLAVTAGAFDPIESLRQQQNSVWLGRCVVVFSELAIATSFIGFVYGLLSVFNDIFRESPSQIARETAGAMSEKMSGNVSGNVSESDGDKNRHDPQNNRSLRRPLRKPLSRYLLVFCPPLGLALLDSNLFFQAIEWSGAFGDTLIFGIFPALVAWKQRYREPSGSISPTFVWGGKVILITMMGLALGTIIQTLIKI